MDEIRDKVISLYKGLFHSSPQKIEKLPSSGSDRVYFRLHAENASYIAAYNADVEENRVFFNMSKHFYERKVNVPELLAISDDERVYIQKDLGDVTLFECIDKNRKEDGSLPEDVMELMRKSLKQLAYMQSVAGADYDYRLTYPVREFDRQSILWDLNYFKYYFVKLCGVGFNEYALQRDFDALANVLINTPLKAFMFRDFQSRNIMVSEDDVYFIDYQGGRLGAPQYDVASLLWQARAQLSVDVKSNLLEYYLDQLENHISFDRDEFHRVYDAYVLIRVLQTLGAYGFRGLYEQKAHFVLSIPLAINNLKYLFENKPFIQDFPELYGVMKNLLKEENQEWLADKNQSGRLTVKVMSFSYKKGLPKDFSGNGGGHIFDCRAIHNPGRYDQYKKLTGRDEPVAAFLDNTPEMQDFLSHVKEIVVLSVENYIARGFENLSVCFGCTGGQHRSVYAADNLARFLANKYQINLVVEHREQDF